MFKELASEDDLLLITAKTASAATTTATTTVSTAVTATATTTATASHGNICVICRHVFPTTSCCCETATCSNNSSSSYCRENRSKRRSRSRSRSRNRNETATTFPSKLLSLQHCDCQHNTHPQQHQQQQQQHVAGSASCCCPANSSCSSYNSNNNREGNNSSSYSTNDNNQKVTATTANCQCNCKNNSNSSSSNDSSNNNNNNQSNTNNPRLQHNNNKFSNCLNILGTLQLFLMQHCWRLFERRRKQQQHNNWRQHSIAYTIITMLALQSATAMAQRQQQQAHNQFERSLTSHIYNGNNIGLDTNGNGNSIGNSIASSNINSNSYANSYGNSVRSVGSKRTVKLANVERHCKSMDIRNTIANLHHLANCTVIEGFLLITLINDGDKLNTTYPLLTEITGFLMVFRVGNLISLSQIFPNLSVIRGNILFESYALVVYLNRDLQDIGFTNLRAISKGGVRIERNDNLCFVDTVNWQKIVSSNATDATIVVKNNRRTDECARCPGDDYGPDSVMTDQSDVAPCRKHENDKRYCWNNRDCQTICPKECPYNCIDDKTCCNASCLGRCTSAPEGDCYACRNVSIPGGTCVDQCADGYFLYEQRCITAETCEKIGKKYVNNVEMQLVRSNGKCTTFCESGYSPVNNTCQKCNGTCEKACRGGVIDSSVRAKEFYGCTIITENGLTISIKHGGQHAIEALENGLSSIHTIDSYLKVHLTYGLTSLSFLKNLRTIKGNGTVDGRYALYVLENRDLESIWAENQTVYINGSVFFHFNPKLCYEQIKKLRPMLAGKPKEFNKNEVAVDSNGDKGKCNTKLLNVEIFSLGTYYVIFTINKTEVNYDDDRTFIGYQFYYTLDPHGNVTRDNYMPCSDDWSVTEPSKANSITISNLQPYTRYAFYARTLTVSSEKRNFQSEIIRKRTRPGKPMNVARISAISTDSSEILLSWSPPLSANGKLSVYLLSVELHRRDAALEYSRNYCRDPMPNAALKDKTSSPDDKVKKPIPDNCKCDKSGRPTYDQQLVEEQINKDTEFENAMQNYLYVHRKNKSKKSGLQLSNITIDDILTKKANRRKRYIEVDNEMDGIDGHLESVLMRHVRSVNISSTQPKVSLTNDNGTWTNRTEMDPTGTYYRVFTISVNASTTEYRFKNLRHFSIYTLNVIACRESENVDNQTEEVNMLCSKAESFDKRTLKKPHADKATNVTANLVERTVNSTRGSVYLRWEAPERPNSAVVSYTIFYERQEQNAVEEKRCITVQDYVNQSGFVVSNLNEGKYSFRIQSNSLAGEGVLTDAVYVTVPPPGFSLLVKLAFGLGGLLILLIILLLSYLLFKNKKTPQDLIINTEVNPFYASLQYVPDDWEVPRERIIQLGPLGQGSFGMVYEGILKAQNRGDDTPCAIKTVNENATDRERTNFLSEASVMKEFDTYHVVRLLGVCSRGQPALVVMELMKKGDLKSYLRAHRPDEREDMLAVYQHRIGLTSSTGTTLGSVQPPPYSRIFQMAIEIADGMAYLAAKKFVHRDLAARNCMVAADLTVKIGDFGMTRDIYEADYYRKGTKGLLPVRWMPPESLRDGVYASSSDVFSYGVVLWEMATLASQPYQGLSNEQVLRYVIDGGIMERPDNCPEVLHKLMHRCWHHRPSARPTFLDIIAYLEKLSDPHFKEVAFYYSEAGVQYREKDRKKRSNQLDIFAGGQLEADADGEGEDATTPLRVGEYQDYKSNMENNSSLDQPAESPIALVDDQATTHSPFSLHSGFIVSSTPDALSTLPTAHGSHMEDDSTVAGYVQADASVANTADAERGYELYDPSPNFGELPHSGCGRLSGEQHLIPKSKRGGANIVHNMSSSMPDEVIGGGGGGNPATGIISSSLQPSTASAASSNASSAGRQPSLKRVMADTFRNRVLSRFSHKRSGSNVSHKSNISNAPSNSSNTNLTSHPAGMAMINMGPNLGTIESGGSGSAGSYTGTPRFVRLVGGGNDSTTIISDNPNYKLLDESVNSADPVHSTWPQQLTTSSLNPNYEMMQPPTAAAATATTAAAEADGKPINVLSSDNPNYVLMSEPQLATVPPASVYTSDNPNYASMLAPTLGQQPSSTDDDENEDDDDDDDEDADEHTEHIKMERMPLSRQVQRRSNKQQQPPRSRSVSQTRKAETLTPALAPALALAPMPTATITATTGNTSNILKENWLRQANTPRPPPPNGFIGREA